MAADSSSRAQAFVASIKSRLSPTASIWAPGDHQYKLATGRWDGKMQPVISIVVEVAEERDVSATVQAANENGLPFLAAAGRHGSMASLNKVRNGVLIDLRRLKTVKIAPDGRSATMGGGVLSGEVVNALWAEKKMTVNGACDITSMVAPMLGGGHGWLQGEKGLIADQLQSANIVLADGSQLTVSETQHADLFWAIKGAGQNFCIVTSFTNTIYDALPTWAYQFLIFTHDKLEGVFHALNTFLDNRDRSDGPEVINFTVFGMVPDVDQVNPVLMCLFILPGSAADLEPWVDPFHALGPVLVKPGEAPYPQLSVIASLDSTGPSSQRGKTWHRFPICFSRYDVPAVRTVFAAFGQLMHDYPATNNSKFLLEAYGTRGVKAVPAEASAFPNREDTLLVSPAICHEPDPSLHPVATQFGEHVREIFFKASGMENLHSYVNYGSGHESLQSHFGYETWRLEKLRGLKRRYDPHNRFGFYAPIES